jgi:hypothetical protein
VLGNYHGRGNVAAGGMPYEMLKLSIDHEPTHRASSKEKVTSFIIEGFKFAISMRKSSVPRLGRLKSAFDAGQAHRKNLSVLVPIASAIPTL